MSLNFEQLLKLMVGSCTCQVKTPEAVFHDKDCTYRVLKEFYDFGEKHEK